MNEIDPYVTKLQAKIEELDAELNKLKAVAKGKGADAEIQFDQMASEYSKKREEMVVKLQEIQESGGSALEDMKEGADRALQEFSAAFEKAKSRFS